MQTPITTKTLSSLLLREDVARLTEFYDDLRAQAALVHISSITDIKGMTSMRPEVAKTLKDAVRTQKTAEISIVWQCHKHRELAKGHAEVYLQILTSLKNNASATSRLDIKGMTEKYEKAFERISQTIDQTRC